MVTTHASEVMSLPSAIPAPDARWYILVSEESVWFEILRVSFLVKWKALCLQNSTDSLMTFDFPFDMYTLAENSV